MPELWRQPAFLIPVLKTGLHPRVRGTPENCSDGPVRGADAFLVETVAHFLY